MTVDVRVTSASESAALDAATIERGIPSRALMQRAGAAAASQVALRFADRLSSGITVFAGEGNNGGDAWVVARALAASGARVAVLESGQPRTDDARFERELALPHVELVDGAAPFVTPTLVIDGLLGTGTRGAPRERVAELIRGVNAAREQGAIVVSLDVPSGVDGTTGAAHDPHVRAHLTLCFGTLKRGLLRARDEAGMIAVLDIGFVDEERGRNAVLATPRWVADRVPPFTADAHKGVRKKVAIMGGARGMAGAVALASRAALRSGVGMVRTLIAPESLRPVQALVPEALASDWPAGEGAASTLRELVSEWADALLIGPGLGEGSGSRERVEQSLDVWRGPVVLDADALNAFAGDADALAQLLDGRPAIITPHLMEFVRLSGDSKEEVVERHFDVGAELARHLRCVVLLKGVPTVVSAPEGGSFISASGTPALATAGSGDVLAGIAVTLLAQMDDPAQAAACAAWIHGRAAELAGESRRARGVTLAEIVAAIGDAWPDPRVAALPYPLLAELPSLGDG